jgi:hypothetical protein
MRRRAHRVRRSPARSRAARRSSDCSARNHADNEDKNDRDLRMLRMATKANPTASTASICKIHGGNATAPLRSMPVVLRELEHQVRTPLAHAREEDGRARPPASHAPIALTIRLSRFGGLLCPNVGHASTAAQSATEWVNCALGIQRCSAAMNGKEAGTYPASSALMPAAIACIRAGFP